MTMPGDDLGPWYTTEQAAPMIGLCLKALQTMCAAKQIECKPIVGATGRVYKYLLSEQMIARYNRRTTQPAENARNLP